MPDGLQIIIRHDKALNGDIANDLDLLAVILIFDAMILIYDLDKKICDLLQLYAHYGHTRAVKDHIYFDLDQRSRSLHQRSRSLLKDQDHGNDLDQLQARLKVGLIDITELDGEMREMY